MKVLHVLESSIPDTGGYVVRAQSIIDQQKRLGMEVAVVTSPLFPAKDDSVTVEHFADVPHFRTNFIPSPRNARSKLSSYLTRVLMMHRYRKAVMRIVEQERPDILHAHSSYLNPLAALPAARRFGLPLVYEVRTLWGESAVVEDGLRADSWKHKLIWNLELKAMHAADRVVPNAQGIRNALVDKGVPADKLEVIPNGVDLAKFTPVPRDAERARSAGLDGNFVVGFIGTMRRLEGLSTLVEAIHQCRARGLAMKCVIVGDGPDRRDLEALAARLGGDSVMFTGTVPHSDVSSWYSVMDVPVYPRLRAVINERVTPLKPLEAMALGKVCVGSDVGGLLELISHDDTGIIFPAQDAAALATALEGLMKDPALMERLRQRAFEYVRTERTWSAIGPRYAAMYEKLLLARHPAAVAARPAEAAGRR